MNLKNVVVVESPSKTKKIAGFLGKDFEVISSVGHIRDLPKSQLGVDTEHDYEPEYVLSDDKKDVIKVLKKEAKQAEAIYLATDEDREGEAIAWHVGYLMNGNNPLQDTSGDADNFQVANKIKNKNGENPKVYRVVFNSITKDAVLSAFKDPRKLDSNLIDAQQARRVLDRLVGYKLSPILWEKIRYGLSAGRVQSVAVRFVVEREREIVKFDNQPFFEIEGVFNAEKKKKELVPAKLVEIDDEKIYVKKTFDLFAGDYSTSITTIDTEKKAKEVYSDIEKQNFEISDVVQKETKSQPSAPFTTSTMQQAASNRNGYTPKRTMALAQKLYEGGHITYMRTDSVNIAPDELKKVRTNIKKEYGEKYLSKKERYYKAKKAANTQEAHEAIRPTDISVKADDLPRGITPQQKKLYELIWGRTMASQMSSAIYENTKIQITNKEIKPSKYLFEAKGSVVVFDGFTKAYKGGKADDLLPALKSGTNMETNELTLKDNLMKPPPRYNESSLVRVLESFGIGRPSTYAGIVATIQSRGYVKKDERTLHPSDNGIVVNDMLVEHFPQIVDVGFTSTMEGELDSIAEGKQDWRKVMDEFYPDFEKLCAEKKKTIKKEDLVNLGETDEECPECKKGHLMIKLGKYGKFLSCNQYPDCKYARPMEEEGEEGNGSTPEEDKALIDGRTCPECNGDLVVKQGRFGKFIACSNYPKCKHTENIQNKLGMKCPDCGDDEKGGEIVVKRTKKGRTFYGCSNYPKCEYASWTKPVEGEDNKSKPKSKKRAQKKKTAKKK